MVNKIHNIDVLKGLSMLEDNSIDTIITSPPYNKYGLSKFGHRKIDYDVYSDDMKEEDYQQWQINIMNECHRVLKPGGSMFYNHKNRRVNCKEHTPHDWITKSNLNLYQTIIWNRNQSPSIFNTFLLPTYEYIFWFTKERKSPRVYRNRLDSIKDIWNITPSRSKIHPATFPEKLVENCVLLTTDEGDVVLDIFSGVGTTCNVSKRLGRDYIGFEISEKYIQ
jgi:site-specific DNA-methyltransferase (adenine-specific)